MVQRQAQAGKPRNLLVAGNRKLGRRILHWSLPAQLTCPGATPACLEHCYARQNNFARPQVIARLETNLRRLLDDPLACLQRLSFELEYARAQVCRIHVAGDFFALWYIHLWQALVARHPDVLFYAYTRSWRIPELRPTLEALALLPNFQLWYSADRDSGLPADVPPGIKVCWLLTQEGECPPPVDLVFRIRPLRQRKQKKVALCLICPQEQSQEALGSTSCLACGVCLPIPKEKELTHD